MVLIVLMNKHCPMYESKFMGEGSTAQIPLRISPEFIASAIYRIDHVDKN